MKKIPGNIAVRVWMVLGLALNLSIILAQGNGPKPELAGLELGFNKTEIEYVTCKLNEPFTPDQFTYSATVEKIRATRMFITASVPESQMDCRISINGAYVKNGERFGFDVQPDQPVQIAVTASDGKTSTYLLTIRAKDLSAEYTAEVVSAGVWRIHDYGGFPGNENMYLVEGKDKAILFDAGLGTGDLAGFVKKLTRKPIEVAITHGHGDHTKQLDQFSNSIVYMSEKDKGMLPKELNTANFKWIGKGDRLDLGGRSFEVLELPTHSKGSLVFLDEPGKLAVVGDAVGSGTMVWAFMVPFKDLAIYAEALRVIEDRIRPVSGLTLLVGHHYQEKVPLTGVNGKQLFTDMRVLTEKVLKGEIIGTLAYTTRNGKVTSFRQAYYGLAGLWYNAL